MKLRTHQLVCMLFLLSALRAAEGSVLTVGHAGFISHDINFLLDQAVPTEASAAMPSPMRRNLCRRNFLRATRIFFKATSTNRLSTTLANLSSPPKAALFAAVAERPVAPPRATAFNAPATQAAAVHATTASGL